MRQCGLAIYLYAEENDRHWPSYIYKDKKRSSIEWYRLYRPYMTNEDLGRHPFTLGSRLPVFDCPSTTENVEFSTHDSHRQADPDLYPEEDYRPKVFDYGLCADTYGYASQEEKDSRWAPRDWVDMREEATLETDRSPEPLRRLDDLEPEQELLVEAYELNPWWGTSQERYSTRVEMYYCGPAGNGQPRRGVGFHHFNEVSTLQADSSVRLQNFTHRLYFPELADNP
jgi:hypothetical protein